MSGLLTSLFKLSAVPARFGLIAADAALSVGKSLVEPEPASDTRASEVFDAITDQEIDVAAGAIRASLLTGQPIDFHDKLRTKFPDATIRSIAEAALLAARNARIGTATSIGSRH